MKISYLGIIIVLLVVAFGAQSISTRTQIHTPSTPVVRDVFTSEVRDVPDVKVNDPFVPVWIIDTYDLEHTDLNGDRCYRNRHTPTSTLTCFKNN